MDGERQVAALHDMGLAMNIQTTYSLSSAGFPDQPTYLAGNGNPPRVFHVLFHPPEQKPGMRNRLELQNHLREIQHHNYYMARLPNSARRAFFVPSFPNESKLVIHLWTFF